LELLRAGHHNLRSVMVTAVKRPRAGPGEMDANLIRATLPRQPPAYTVAFIPRYALQVGAGVDGNDAAQLHLGAAGRMVITAVAVRTMPDHRRRCDGRAGSCSRRSRARRVAALA
jgi:hypothetical protein